MLIRLLQNFNQITLDEAAQPPESRPPASWAHSTSRASVERVRSSFHLTMFIPVSSSSLLRLEDNTLIMI